MAGSWICRTSPAHIATTSSSSIVKAYITAGSSSATSMWTATTWSGGNVIDDDCVTVVRAPPPPDRKDLIGLRDQISTQRRLLQEEHAKIASGKVPIPPGKDIKLTMPDGSFLIVHKNGNWEINDKDAQVTYKANRVREFNPYVNASDLLERFIQFVAKQRVTQQEFLQLPIELFITWLIIEAAVQDGEPVPADEQQLLHQQMQQLALPAPRYLPRCKCCGRFITRVKAAVAQFCNGDHMNHWLEKHT